MLCQCIPIVRAAVWLVLLVACDDQSTSAAADGAASVDAIQPTRIDGGPSVDSGADAEVARDGASLAEADGASDCVDIWVDEWSFPDHENWVQYRARLPRKPFDRDAAGIHAAFQILDKRSGEAQQQLRGEVAVVSYSASTGAVLAARRYDVLPHIGSPGNRGTIDFAVDGRGTFAVLIAYGPGGDTGPTYQVLVGALDDPSQYHLWTLPWDTLVEQAHHLSWDGEAFAVHGYRGNDWLLARLAPDGTPLLERRVVGNPRHTRRDDLDYHTDPVTGRTMVVTDGGDDVGASFWLAGHERDGTPLVDMPPGGVEVGPLFVTTGDRDTWRVRPLTVRVAHNGRWWLFGAANHLMGERRYPLARLGDAITVVPPVYTFPGDTVPNAGASSVIAQTRLVGVPGFEFPWLVGLTWHGIERFALGSSGFAEREVVVSDQIHLCRSTRTCDGTPWTPHRIQTISAMGEVWMGYIDNTIIANGPSSLLEPNSPYRIVRLDGNCRYRTLREQAPRDMY